MSAKLVKIPNTIKKCSNTQGQITQIATLTKKKIVIQTLPFRQVSCAGVEVLADRNNFFALIVSHFHILKELVSHHFKCIFRPRLTNN